MSQYVYMYPLEITDVSLVPMPVGAVPLTVQTQGDHPCLWVRADPDAPTVLRRFRWAGTGHPLGEHAAWEYVGTVQLNGGILVLHLFAEPSQAKQG